jgi:hypothetical protein
VALAETRFGCRSEAADGRRMALGWRQQ